ncbi:hypothetical protein [Devosia sp. MC521]|uniref:hypothetical protein n=1 Tax=Devosia sp. MC521 TaxID=2759954 RepID=UPI0015F8E1D7|nr:hypothetical protein [Devosia sp. MC521]MBJ6987273.1 hypothetical protein [Devosia sp. MC521]QMW62881.1 hypothetical protein H4N61_00470 [Devosia sp. MC521]
MTTSSLPAVSSTAQMILQDTAIIKRDLITILELAKSTALPLEGEQVSVLETMVRLLQMIVNGVEQNRKAIEVLHQRLDEPGIAQTLRRMIEAD